MKYKIHEVHGEAGKTSDGEILYWAKVRECHIPDDEVDTKIKRVLNAMKPYTIKASDDVRIADLTHEQFASIVNKEYFWFDDEPAPTKTDKQL